MTWLTALFVAVGIAAHLGQLTGDTASADAIKRRLVGNWKLVKYDTAADGEKRRQWSKRYSSADVEEDCC